MKIIEYLEYHKNDPVKEEDEEDELDEEERPKISEDIDSWDKEFIKLDQGTLFELILVLLLF